MVVVSTQAPPPESFVHGRPHGSAASHFQHAYAAVEANRRIVMELCFLLLCPQQFITVNMKGVLKPKL